MSPHNLNSIYHNIKNKIDIYHILLHEFHNDIINRKKIYKNYDLINFHYIINHKNGIINELYYFKYLHDIQNNISYLKDYFIDKNNIPSEIFCHIFSYLNIHSYNIDIFHFKSYTQKINFIHDYIRWIDKKIYKLS